MTKCESCVFYRFLSSQTDSCPYWRPGDDYLTARRQ